jgi:hypothetical protein
LSIQVNIKEIIRTDRMRIARAMSVVIQATNFLNKLRPGFGVRWPPECGRILL